MKANRYQTPTYRRPYREIGPVFWTGSLAAAAVLAGILYYLLTHQVSA